VVWRFLKHYGMTKASGILNDFASAVVAFDPQTATKAQVAMMEVELNKLGGRLSEAEAEVRREHNETLDIEGRYEQYLQAAKILEHKLAETEGSEKKEEIEASLIRVVECLEQLKPELERERHEDQEVESWRCELRRSFEELVQKVRAAQNQMGSAHRQMERARLQRDLAEEQERRNMETAGLASSINSLSVALDSMNQQTSKFRAEAEAFKLKAGLFQPDRLESDPNVAAALAAARGKVASGYGSISDRLAALKNSAGKPLLTPAA